MIIGNMGCMLYWVAIFWQSPELEPFIKEMKRFTVCSVPDSAASSRNNPMCQRRGEKALHFFKL